MGQFQEALLGLFKASLDGSPRIGREIRVSDDQLVQLISQVVRAPCSAMPIVDRKERAARPVAHLLKLWLDYVQND